MITQQRLEGYCIIRSALRLIKSIVKVVTFFFFKALFSGVLALNLFLSFFYYNRKAHISLNVSRGKLKITPTVSR